MATFFVDSNAAGANDGSSFADAFTSISSVVIGGASPPSGGDLILIASNHSEALAAEVTFGNAATDVERVLYISVNSSTEAFEVGASITSTADFNFDNCNMWGVTLSTTSRLDTVAAGGSLINLCDFTGSRFDFAGNCVIEDTDIETTLNNIAIRNVGSGALTMRGGSWTASAVNANQNLTSFAGSRGGVIELIGVDVSGVPAGRFVEASGGTHNGGRLRMVGCLLNANTTIIANPANESDVEAEIINCGDSTSTVALSDFRYLSRRGSCVMDTTRTRTDGASDGETDYSFRMTGTAENTRKSVLPVKSGVYGITRWVQPGDTNLRIHIAHDAVGSGTAGVLQSDECWAEYFGPSQLVPANPLLNRITSKTEFGVTPTDLTTDTDTWSGTEVGTRQRIDIAINPTEAGYAQVFLFFAPEDDVADVSINFCPKLEVT
ncbi:MAG: hypothetical protein ACR2RE_04770 [Geminicoccaceae bacterium]